MARFIQLHFLTSYPPSNPNRDDQGRPKTAIYGGVMRLRLSSQSLKRAARLSDAMKKGLEGHMGDRTRQIGAVVRQHLLGKDADEKKATEIAKKIADTFGKLDDNAVKKDPAHIYIRQLAFISPEEKTAAIEWADKMFAGEEAPKNLKKCILRSADGAVDVAMFGRMLADDPEFNREAAVQLSHAITTHKAFVEDDYYTAVDDLKRPSEDMGAGFVGDAGFGSGVYYLYACIDTNLLLENLSGDRNLARRALDAVTEAFATSSPSGKRNSFSHHTRASYIRAESGDQQPRSLAAAFLKPVMGDDLMDASVYALENMAANFDKSYGPQSDAHVIMNVAKGEGNISEVQSFVSGQIEDE